MIAVDTNVVVRFLTKDDPIQFEKSVEIFSKQEIFLPDIVVLETEWVLRFAYAYSPAEIAAAFNKLFGLPNVHLYDDSKMALALTWHRDGLDFADALHRAHANQCEQLLTFDRRFFNRAQSLISCPVRMPD